MTTLYGRGRRAALALLALLPLAVMQAHAEDGYDLWLRYHPIADESQRAHYKHPTLLKAAVLNAIRRLFVTQ